MKRPFVLLAAAVFVGCASVKPLKLVETRRVIAPGAARFDPSGLLLRDGRWFTVSDKPEYPHLYRLAPSGKDAFRLEVYLKVRNLQDLPGSDYEGMALCAGRVTVVEETTTALITFLPDARVEARKLDLGFEPRNAGLEGVACSPEGRLWVSKERDPRRIYELSPSTFGVLADYDVDPGEELPRTVGTRTVSTDFSDLHYDAGFLYALQRNDRTILKIDPDKRAVVARAKMKFDERALYHSDEPFGMAEGLFLTPEHIAVVLDNNGMQRRDGSGRSDALFFLFKRPVGF